MKVRRTKAEIDKIARMSDDQLLTELVDCCNQCCGVDEDDLYDRGYDIQDIEELSKAQKEWYDYYDMLEEYCDARGLKPFCDEKKPKFNIDEWQGNYAMHCNTKSKAVHFCMYLNSKRRIWWTGRSYVTNTNWDTYRKNTCYFFNKGTYEDNDYAENVATVLEYDDFDWSDNNG